MKIERLILGLLHTNCYIVYNEKTLECAVIDPADNFDAIKSKLDELNLKTEFIILTHAHWDHFGALDELKKYTGAKLIMGKNEANSLSNACLNLTGHFRKKAPESHADIIVDDNEEMKIAGNTFRFIFTPGHTKGSISIYTGNFVFSGDTLFYESIGRTDFESGNINDIMDSIKNKLFSLPNDTIVFSGHGEQTTIGHEKDNNPYVW